MSSPGHKSVAEVERRRLLDDSSDEKEEFQPKKKRSVSLQLLSGGMTGDLSAHLGHKKMRGSVLNDPFYEMDNIYELEKEEDANSICSEESEDSDHRWAFLKLGSPAFMYFIQRRLWRAFLATIAITLLCTALYFWFRAVTVTEERVLNYLDRYNSKLIFEIDSCNILFRDEGGSFAPDHITASVELEKTNRASVQWIGDDAASTFKLVVKNEKPFAYRYDEWFCDITVNVPKGKVLPFTHVEATGRLFSSIRSYRGKWGNNSLSVHSRPLDFGSKVTFLPGDGNDVSKRPYVAINLYDVEVGRLDFNISRGYVNVKRGIILDGGNITTTNANVYLRLAQSFALENNRPDDFMCINAWQHNCTSWVKDKNSTYCNQNILLANSTTDPRTWPRKPITVNCTSCLIHATALEKFDSRPPQTLKGSAFNKIGFAPTDVARIKDAFNMNPPRDLIYFGVTGPGSATTRGRWVWSTRDIYVVFHPSYLDVFSVFLLSPRRADLNLTLTPTFCPGLNDDIDLEVLVAIDGLLKSTFNVVPRPDSIYLFENGFQSEWFRTNQRIMRDAESGEYYSTSPSFRSNVNLLIILILNILLTFFSAVYVTWLVWKKSNSFRVDLVDRWGSLWYQNWALERKRVMRRAGLYFLLEFIVGFPKQRRGFLKQGLTVFIHIFFILMIVFPTFLMISLYKYSIVQYTHVTPWGTLILGYGFCAAYLLFSFGCLFLYYLEVGIINYYLSWGLGIATTIFMFIDLLFIINVMYWILLGSLIKPARILPFASVVMVMVFHFIAFVSRIRKLRNTMNEEIEAGEKIDEEHKDSTNLKGTLSVQEAVGILKNSQLLSISDLTIREQIIQEIITFLLLILFFSFLLIGFNSLDVTAVGSGDTVGGAVSTLIVFFIGSGVNVPLSQSSSETRKKKWEQTIIQEAQKQRELDALKKE